MWTVLVVVPGVLGQYGGQVLLAEDEQPVGALAADRRVGTGARCRGG
jgi:hypothetical protein